MDRTDSFDVMKEHLRAASDIVDLVGSYIPLRRQGRNFVGNCPWHDDSRPSLQVNPERQTFKCWVCDLGGDVFSFVMRMEGVDFREALAMLADRAGIPLHAGRPSGAKNQTGSEPSDKRTLYGAMAWAEQLFHNFLLESRQAQPARDYLSGRGITTDTVQKFHLGFSPPRWDWLLEQAQATNWTTTVLERVGLVIRRESGDGCYDRFRGRLMFSIRDARSRPIAFGGRVLPQLADERSAKYINSPETPLFAKSRELYGLDQARDAISKSREAVVMEGYTDCLMAQQHGIANAVAVLGTALGGSHLSVLRRYADSMTLVLDGDEAGRRRSNEILELFVGHQVNLQILTLPEGADPCDFIGSHGGDAFRQLLSRAVDALEHRLLIESDGVDVNIDTHRTTQAVEGVLSTLARARPGAGVATSTMLLREQQMLVRTARHFRLPEESLRRRLLELRRKTDRRPLSTAGTPRSPQDEHRADASPRRWPSWERELLEIILLDASQLTTISQQIDPAAIQTPLARQLYVQSVELWHGGDCELFNQLMLRAENEDTKHALVTLDEQSQAKSSSDLSMRLRDLAEAYESSPGRRQLPPEKASAASESDAAQQLAQFVAEARPSQLNLYQRSKQ